MNDGDPLESRTTGSMMDAVYAELRRLAAARMAGERPGHTLQATALVNQAYLKLHGPEGEPRNWEDKRAFLAAAANAMKRILVEHARSRNAARRRHEAVEFHDSQITGGAPLDDLLAVDEALELFDKEHPERSRAAEIVKLRYFVGYTMEEIAREIGVSKKTVDRDWNFARAWLYNRLKNEISRS